jgi:GNAT superfamily N-acetyltransferase
MDGIPTSADLVVRSATDADALPMSFLLEDLGHPIEPARIVEKLGEIRDSALDRVWVVEVRGNAVVGEDQALAGLLGFHAIPLLHTAGRLGRITALVVHPRFRGMGIGRRLVDVAEHFARGINCERLEVTSGEQRHDAHRFYSTLGFSPQSARFVKVLG